MMFYNSQPAWNRRLFFKIEKQFTQYRLLINHNKYTFHYIIRNKYWNIKPNTGFPHGCHHISLLTLYALAQLIRTIGFADATDCLKAVRILPSWHVEWQVPATRVSHKTSQTLAPSLLIIVMLRIFAAWKWDKYQYSCRSRELKVTPALQQRCLLKYCSPPLVEQSLQFPSCLWF